MTSPTRWAPVLLFAALLLVALVLLSHRGTDQVLPPGSRPESGRFTEPSQTATANIQKLTPGQGSQVSAPAGVSLIRNTALTPTWAIPFGTEFWRRPSAHPGTVVSTRTAAVGLPANRLGDAIDRVTHAFESTAPGAVRAAGGSFHANLDASGLALSPAKPKAPGKTQIRFTTRSISVGSRELYADDSLTSEWCVSGNTAQRLLDPASGLVAHYEVRHDGVEVSWIAPRPLPTSGDLTIQATVSGAQFHSPDNPVEAWSGDTGVPRLKVGPALAVDADGRSWHLEVALAENELRVTVPAAILAAATFPLAVDPLITPEFTPDALTNGPSPCTRAAPVVAANESGYFLVWTHGKSDITDAAVYGARVSATGELLDPHGILISSRAAEQTVCAVAANHDMFLVAWAALHGTSLLDWDILGSRVLPDGTVVDSSPLPICTVASSVQNSPAVAANGDNFLVAWRDSRNTGIYGTIVGVDGKLSVANGVSLLNGSNDQYTPAVAALGTNYLVVAQDYRKATSSAYNSDIYGARVDGTGALLDSAGFPICTNALSQFNPAVASDGTNYLVVWQDHDLGGSDIVGARVSPEGQVLDANALVICHGANSQCYPSVAADGATFLVAWQDYRNSPSNNFEAQIYGARVLSDGSVMDSGGVRLSPAVGGQHRPRIAALSGVWLAVWQDFRDNPDSVLSDVIGTRIREIKGLWIDPEALLSGAWNAQISPAVAALGTNYLAVWADNRNGLTTGWDICGMRLDLNGAPLDLSPLWICTATNRQAEPTVAAGQDSYFVAWSDWRNTPATLQHPDIYGSVISADGTVQQPGGMAICTATNAQSLPSVAAFGTNFLVVWQDARFSLATASRLDIFGARVTGSGTVLDAEGLIICTNAAVQIDPVVVATSNRALVVWADYRLNVTYPDVFGARINPDGSVIETNGLPICVASFAQNLPAAASDGTNFLVVWADSRNGVANAPDIYGTLVGNNGILSPTNGFPIRVGAGPQTAPAIAFNGRDFLVVWQTAPNSTTNSFDVAAVQVSTDGGISLGPVLPLNPDAGSQVSATVASGANGQFLVISQESVAGSRQAAANFINSELVPRLDAPTVDAKGQFQFRFRGALGSAYAIESSDDLQVWTRLWTFTNSSPSSILIDPATTNLPGRFYRAILLP